MAVYKRGYQRYRGPLTAHWMRILALPRFAWERLFHQRLVIVFLCIALVWPLLCAFFVYVSNHTELWAGFGGDVGRFLKVDGNFFLIFMNVQSVFAMLLAALAGPGLIAPDLANNALPLYFSRPISRPEYVFARLLVLLGMLSLVTWVPGIVLFGLQASMAGWSWFSNYWNLGVAVLAGFLLWIVVVSLVALASSAYVRWKVVAGALVLAFFSLMAGVGEMVNAVFRVQWGSLLNPARSMNRLWYAMLGVEAPEGLGISITAAIVMLVVLVGLLLLVLERKLRPVEVIS